MNGFIQTVKKGECLSKIASQYGLTWQQLWHHNDNQKLNHKRKDPDVILEGDEVFIPESKPLIITMRTGESKVVQVNLPKNRITLSIYDFELEEEPLKTIEFAYTNLLPDAPEDLKAMTHSSDSSRREEFAI